MIVTCFAALSTSAAEEADKPYEGQTVRVLLNAHPWQEAIEPMVSEFEEATGIKVEITTLGEDIYWDRVNLGLSSAEPPFDVFMLSPNMTGYNGYINGWIANLDDYVYQSEEYDFDDIYPYIVDGFRFPDAEGSIYGIPLTMETYIVFYRKDLFEEQGIVFLQPCRPYILGIPGNDIIVRADLRVAEFIVGVRMDTLAGQFPDKHPPQDTRPQRTVYPLVFAHFFTDVFVKLRLIRNHL